MSQKETSYEEWAARVLSGKYELGGSYAVLIFIGPVPESPSEWRKTSNYVGAHHVLVSGMDKGRDREHITEGFVLLNDAIAERSGLHSFDPSVVEPYLTKELGWRIQKVNGDAVDPKDLHSLEIVVTAQEIVLKPGEVFPKPVGVPQKYPEITRGRPGGYKEA